MNACPSGRAIPKLSVAGLAAGALAKPAILRAQGACPDRPVNFVVPFATGGYNDRVARAFAPHLRAALGQPTVIVNRSGAGAQFGHTYALQQPADGYTIVCTSAAPCVPLNILLRDAPFTIEDFQMINPPSRDYTIAATSANSDIESMQDAIGRLEEDPRSLSLGVQPASADYANLVLTLRAAGVEPENIRIVTYDGGGPARHATAGGQVNVGFVGGEGFLPLKDRVKPLAIYAAEAPEWWPGEPITSAAEIETEHVGGDRPPRRRDRLHLRGGERRPGADALRAPGHSRGRDDGDVCPQRVDGGADHLLRLRAGRLPPRAQPVSGGGDGGGHPARTDAGDGAPALHRLTGGQLRHIAEHPAALVIVGIMAIPFTLRV